MAATDGAQAAEMHERAHPPTAQFDELNGFIGFKLRLAQECVFRAFASATDDPDLKPRVFSALCVIAQFPGISQSDLGAHVGRDKSTITPMIADLIAGGFVQREHAVADRRSFHLNLTAKGRALLDRQWRAARHHEARLDAALGSPDARAEFMRNLERLIAVFG
jgi:DNA-binding MarR family transcriptional regulator